MVVWIPVLHRFSSNDIYQEVGSSLIASASAEAKMIIDYDPTPVSDQRKITVTSL